MFRNHHNISYGRQMITSNEVTNLLSLTLTTPSLYHTPCLTNFIMLHIALMVYTRILLYNSVYALQTECVVYNTPRP